jgi:hypothetical protein
MGVGLDCVTRGLIGGKGRAYRNERRRDNDRGCYDPLVGIATPKVFLLTVLATTALGCPDPAHAPNAKPMPDATVHAICTSESGGDGATIQVWRESDGTFVVNELSNKAHESPLVYFDDDGRETMRISSHSDTPSSPEALEAGRRRDLATRDGTKAEKIPCTGK